MDQPLVFFFFSKILFLFFTIFQIFCSENSNYVETWMKKSIELLLASKLIFQLLTTGKFSLRDVDRKTNDRGCFFANFQPKKGLINTSRQKTSHWLIILSKLKLGYKSRVLRISEKISTRITRVRGRPLNYYATIIDLQHFC